MRRVLLVALLLPLAGCLQESTEPEPMPPAVVMEGAIPHPWTLHAADGSWSVSGDPLAAGDAVPEIPEAYLPWFQAGFSVGNVDTGFAGAEPNVGVTPSGCVFASAYEDIIRSCDGGASWELSYSQQVGFTSDPMLWVDTDTGRVFSPQMFPILTCSNHIYSDDDGTTWLETPLACGTPVVDHQKVATGTPALGPEGPLYPNLVSYCYNKLAGTFCAVSYDGGFQYETETKVDSGCGGLNGHQHHAPDGTLYVPYGFNCGSTRISVSTDNGLTWDAINLGDEMHILDPEVATTPDLTAYYLYRGPGHDMWLQRTTDRFQNTEGPWKVSPEVVKGTVFGGMTSGEDGHIAIAYLGSTTHDGIPDDAPPGNQYHLFVGISHDADADVPVFLTVQVTEDPVQRGSVCQEKGCNAGNRNLLDFIDMHAGPDGRFWVSYADGCISESCVSGGGPETSRDDRLTIAYLDEGVALDGSLL